MHIHIIGIAGTMTASLAKALQKQGHFVTGSDQEKIYPPVSNILESAKITINNTPIAQNIDLAIVGSSYKAFARTREEFEQIKKLKIPFISATEYIAKYIGKTNSILVAGSYGKTTITSLLVWIFKKANLNPSYMFGGQAINNFDSLEINSSDWSIIEADESINGLDTQAKFLYYPVKYLVLTSANWEHKDSYQSESDNFEAFKNLVKKLPENGLLLINSTDINAKKLSQYSKAKVLTYTPPPGPYNLGNILAATTLSLELKINPQIIQEAVASFQGIKRRLELIKQKNNIRFFDDFAQSAPRITSAISSIKQSFPGHQIKIFFEPNASFLQNKKSLMGFSEAFSESCEVVLGKIKYNRNADKKNRVTASDFQKEIGPKLIYLPLETDIIKHYQQSLKQNDILIHMSSGGLSGLKTFNKIINQTL